MTDLPCPVGTKSHLAHDDRIRELEEFRKHVAKAPRVLAERVIKLEKALLTINERYEKQSAKLQEANALLKKWM